MNTTDINAPQTEDDKGQQVFQRIVARFRKRARGHSVISYVALVLTVLVLGGGIYIFAVADELAATRFGASYEEISKVSGPVLKETSRSLQEIGETADKVGKDFKDTASALLSYLKSDAAKSLPEKLERDPEVRKAMLKFLNEINTQQINSILNDGAETAKEAASVAQTLSQTLGPSSAQQTQMALLAKAISTRVMAVILSIFLVQLLIGLYRYNTRMAAYYDGRADALELSRGDKKEMLEILIPLLSAETIDFGKGPSSPVDRVVDLAKAIASKRG